MSDKDKEQDLDFEKRLSTVEAHSEFCNKLLEKMDASIGKQVDILTELQKIVAVHENRLDNVNKETADIKKDQEKQEKIVTKHSTYFWMVLGILAFIGFVAKVIPAVISVIYHTP